MKKLTTLTMMALMICSAAPAFPQDTPQDQYLCKVQAGNCVKGAEAVQRKMKRIESDIKKGKKTYSAEDLKKIELKLKEVEDMLDNLKAK